MPLRSIVCPLLIFSAVLLIPERGLSQEGAAIDVNSECFCDSRIAVGIREGPANLRHLVDGWRYDLASLVMVLTPEIADPDRPGNVPQSFTMEPFAATSMMVVTPDVSLLPDRRYGLNAQPTGSPDALRIGSTFDIRDFVDTTPPVAGALEITGEVFENECGAQALYFEDEGTGDDFWAGGRFAILVTFRAGEHEFQTVTTSFGSTQTTRQVVSKAPYLGDCITDEGLETLDFDFGETVEATMVVYDYALNASEPVTQSIEWPIGGPAGTGGSTGTGGSGAGASSGGGGCAVGLAENADVPFSVTLLLALMLMLRRRSACQTGSR